MASPCPETPVMLLGLHIIWTTYETWLPGDPRGHWSSLLDMYGRVAAPGHRARPADEVTETYASGLMKEDPKLLAPEEMRTTADVIASVLGGRSIGNFVPAQPGTLAVAHALAIEATHVHLLLGPLTAKLAPTMGRIKGISSSLIRAEPRNAGRKRIWTESYWDVRLYDAVAIAQAQGYSVDHNLRRGLPAHPYAWLKPFHITVPWRGSRLAGPGSDPARGG
jgi:hypothetical protein